MAAIIFAMKKGIKHSQKASSAMKKGVIIEGFLYSLTLPKSGRITPSFFVFSFAIINLTIFS